MVENAVRKAKPEKIKMRYQSVNRSETSQCDPINSNRSSLRDKNKSFKKENKTFAETAAAFVDLKVASLNIRIIFSRANS